MAKAINHYRTDVEERGHRIRTRLETLVVYAVNNKYYMLFIQFFKLLNSVLVNALNTSPGE